MAVDGRSVLLCRVGSLVCAFPLEHVVETMRAQPLEAFAGMPAFVSGVSIIRGGPVPVVDLATLLGEEHAATRDKLVTIRVDDRRVALAVESVLAIRTLPSQSIAGLPPLLGRATSEVVSAVSTLDSQLLVIIETGRVVPSSAWDALGAHGAQA